MIDNIRSAEQAGYLTPAEAKAMVKEYLKLELEETRARIASLKGVKQK